MFTIPTALALGLAASAVLEPVDLRFAPPVGTTRTLTVLATTTMDGGHLKVTMNEEPVPDHFLPELSLDSSDETSLEVIETFLKGDEGGPTEWLRRYEVASNSSNGSFRMAMQGGEPVEMPWVTEAECKLPGTLLRMNCAEGELGHELMQGAALPDELGADLSYAFLLPAEAVSEGDSWKVEGEQLEALLVPGGDLGFEFDEEAQEFLRPNYDSIEVQGELRLSLKSLSAAAAVIEVKGEIERVSVGPGDLSQVPVVDGTATNTTTETFEVEGELEWDLTANSLSELNLAGPVTSDTVTVRDPDQEGPTYESSFAIPGDWKLEVTSAATDHGLIEAASGR